MKRIPLLMLAFCGLTVFAQKSKPILQATFVSTIVNEGTKNHFSDNTNKRDLTFTIDAEAKLNGEITIKNANAEIIFKGTMKDNVLVDSAMWFENNKLVKVANFKDKCCTSTTDYVDPTPKSLSSIKGERHGIERIFHSSNPLAIKAINHYQSGKKQGKQYEYNLEKKIISIRTYKDDKLNDTSWLNCTNKVPDMEIYANDIPTGVWKKYNTTGTLLQAAHKLSGGDSTILYGADGKVSSIRYTSVVDYGQRTCREYDAKAGLTKQYYLKFGGDTVGEVMHGMYEEYVNGKIKLRGEYWYGTKIETWITFNAKGSETNWESFVTRDIAMAAKPDVVPVVTTTTAAAVDLFPPALTKSTITMELSSNGKIEKLFKKTQEINWSLDVKSPTDYKVICTDESITETERTDVVDYITSCITMVKGVRYSHKEVNFVTNYKLVFK